MSVEMVSYVQQKWRDSKEYSQVQEIAQRLLLNLNTPEVLRRIEKANLPNRSSREIQDAFIEEAQEIGFKSESKGLFSNYHNKALRPDYYMRVGKNGIILEVERGKTTTNNMHLLDFWKCHICDHADYLFLMVPKELLHGKTIKKEFANVKNSLASFFDEKNYKNVRGLVIYGY